MKTVSFNDAFDGISAQLDADLGSIPWIGDAASSLRLQNDWSYPSWDYCEQEYTAFYVFYAVYLAAIGEKFGRNHLNTTLASQLRFDVGREVLRIWPELLTAEEGSVLYVVPKFKKYGGDLGVDLSIISTMKPNRSFYVADLMKSARSSFATLPNPRKPRSSRPIQHQDDPRLWYYRTKEAA